MTVYKAQGMLPAQVVKAKLEAAGIPVFLKYESLGQVMGFTVDGLGLVQVQVPPDLAEDARSLLAEEPDAGADQAWQSGSVEGENGEPADEAAEREAGPE